MVRTMLIACNVAAVVMMIALVLPTMAKAEMMEEVVMVEMVQPVDVVKAPTFTPPQGVTLYVPMYQMAINRVLSNADPHKVRAVSTRTPIGRAVRRGTFLYPRREWPVYAPEKFRVNPAYIRTARPQ